MKTSPPCIGHGQIGCTRCRPTSGWNLKHNKAVRDRAYADPVYRRIRRETLSRKPICSYTGCTRVSTTLDHVVPIALGRHKRAFEPAGDVPQTQPGPRPQTGQPDEAEAAATVIISSGVLVPAEIARLVGSWRAEQEHQ